MNLEDNKMYYSHKKVNENTMSETNFSDTKETFFDNNSIKIYNIIDEILIDQNYENKNMKSNDKYNKKIKLIENKYGKSKMKNTDHKKWNKNEENLFYELLKKHGMNFKFIEVEFAYHNFLRTRKQIMLKFNRECKINSEKMNLVLR